MRILALTKYGAAAASTRQRFLLYRPALAEQGISLDFMPLIPDDQVARIGQGRRPGLLPAVRGYARRLRALASRDDYDLLWVAYELFPYLPAMAERLAFLPRKPVVVDFDDAVFHMYDRHPNPIVRRLLAGKLAPLLRGAALIVCGNDYIQAHAGRFSARTMIVPTVVDTGLYVPAPKACDAPLVIGWIGSPSTWRFVEPYAHLLAEVAGEAGAMVLAVGAGPAAEGLAGIEARAWREEDEIADVQSMDIGIMPLPDEPWTRGKCGYKLIQYMACGLPVVASPVGVNTQIVIPGRSGFLARSEGEWREALAKLLGDAGLRAELGARGRARAVEHYSLASQAPRLVEAFRTLARPAPGTKSARRRQCAG